MIQPDGNHAVRPPWSIVDAALGCHYEFSPISTYVRTWMRLSSFTPRRMMVLPSVALSISYWANLESSSITTSRFAAPSVLLSLRRCKAETRPQPPCGCKVQRAPIRRQHRLHSRCRLFPIQPPHDHRHTLVDRCGTLPIFALAPTKENSPM